MSLRYRPMRPKDVEACVRIIGEHPVIGPRYGRAIADLERAWARLLTFEAKRAIVFEKVDEPHATICAVGVSVFVKDEFVREIKRPPLFWFGPELAKRVIGRECPVISEKEFEQANSYGGLNLLVWESCYRREFESDRELHGLVMSSFLEEHRGFLLKELISSQLENADRLRWTISSGARLWDAFSSRYLESLNGEPDKILKEPHVVGLTRDLELGCTGPWSSPSWVGTLFNYRQPRIGFSQSEQQLLLAAVSGSGATDEELGEELGVALDTVKNTWRSIYDRAASCLPELFPEAAQIVREIGLRGKGKRRHLLAYVREHPEELRPVSRRFLQHVGAGPRD